jgi:hypothetical protein
MVAVTTAALMKEDSPLLGRNDGHEMTDSTSSVRWAESARSVSSALLEKFTKSERGEALMRQGVGPAAFLIRDAVMGVEESLHDGHYDPYADKENETRSLLSIICGRLTGNRKLVLCLNGTVWILALLSFVEPPCWCRGIQIPDGDTHKYGSCGVLLSATGPSTDDDNVDETWVEYYPNSSSMLLTVGQSMAAEWILVSIVTLFLLMRLGRDGFQIRRFFRQGLNRLVRTIQCVSVVLLYLGLVKNRTDHHPFVRLVLLASFMTDSHLELFTLFKMVSYQESMASAGLDGPWTTC